MPFPAFQAGNSATLTPFKKSSSKHKADKEDHCCCFTHYWSAAGPAESTRAAAVQAHGGVIWLAKLSMWAALGVHKKSSPVSFLTREVKKTLLQTAVPANPGVYNTLSTTRVWKSWCIFPREMLPTDQPTDATSSSWALRH